MRLFKTTLPAQPLEDEAAAVRLLAITNRTEKLGLCSPLMSAFHPFRTLAA